MDKGPTHIELRLGLGLGVCSGVGSCHCRHGRAPWRCSLRPGIEGAMFHVFLGASLENSSGEEGSW